LPCVVGNVVENARAPPIPPSEHLDDGFRTSNSVEVEPQAMNVEEAHDMDDDEPYYMNEEEPYDIARASDSDNDRPVRELTESDVELMKCVLPGVDIMVHEFSNLELSGMAIAVIRKRPYKVLHSYVER
jgi:hypothetical protein